MGRDIRMVPKGWEHPRDTAGNYIGLLDRTYEQALADHEDDGGDAEDEPQPEWYRRAWEPGEDVCYQVYETVSEGTPVSPVFDNEDDMLKWLILEGYSEYASKKFIEYKHAPSMMMCDGNMYMNIHMYDVG